MLETREGQRDQTATVAVNGKSTMNTISSDSLSSNFSIFEMTFESTSDKELVNMVMSETHPACSVNVIARQPNESPLDDHENEKTTDNLSAINTPRLLPSTPAISTKIKPLAQLGESTLIFDLNDSSVHFKTRLDSDGLAIPITPNLSNSEEVLEVIDYSFRLVLLYHLLIFDF